jgi:hypothetical protein
MASTFDDKIKAWLTPGLITCFGFLSWSLITEIRADVKVLLESNAQVKTKVENLEKRMDGLESVFYNHNVLALFKNEKRNRIVEN